MNDRDLNRIKHDLKLIRESGLPSQAQIKQSQANSKIFTKAQQSYKDLLAFLKKWDRGVGGGEADTKQLAALKVAYTKALKDIEPFWNSDSTATMTAGTAAQKLQKQTKTTLDGIKWLLSGK